MENIKTRCFIWRLENQEGRGCYSTLSTKWILFNHINDYINHPTPWQDPKILRPREKGEVCGFLTLAQVLRWFTIHQLFILRRMGFCLKRIKVILTANGKTQVLGRKLQGS